MIGPYNPDNDNTDLWLVEQADAGTEDSELLVPNCPNICCTGAFIQEGMMGVVMSAEVTNEI